jgi:hypothetical protein
LAKLHVLTVEELVRRGADEVGQLCGLKIGPKTKLAKALKGVGVAVVPLAAVVEVAPLAPEPISAELREVLDSTFIFSHVGRV